MKNAKIAVVLKYYRKLTHKSVSDVAEELGKSNICVAEKTIYGWESGQTQPDADTLMVLCKIYGIEDILGTFGYENKDKKEIVLTEFERKLILRYREAEDMQDAVKKLLNL